MSFFSGKDLARETYGQKQGKKYKNKPRQMITKQRTYKQYLLHRFLQAISYNN